MPVCPNKVLKLMLKLSNKKATGLVGILSKLIKLSAPYILLCQFLTSSIVQYRLVFLQMNGNRRVYHLYSKIEVEVILTAIYTYIYSPYDCESLRKKNI